MHIIVIGAGLIGVTSAWFLHRAGHQVTVIDRAESAGMETSYANGSMLTASHSRPWNNPGVFMDLIKWLGKEDAPMLVRSKAIPEYTWWGLKFIRNSAPGRYRENCRRNHNLGVYSLRMMAFIREQENIQYHQASPGIITIYRDNKAWNAAANHPLNTQLNLDLNVLDVDELVSLQPSLEHVSKKLAGGIHYKNEETGDAQVFCNEMHRVLEARGVNFEFGTEVTGFRRSGRRITAVTTNMGEHAADSYVLATASESPRLTRRLGFDLPIKPVKGYSLTCERGTWPEGPRIPVIDDRQHAAIVPLGERIRVTSTAEFAGYDMDLPGHRVDNLLHLLADVYPEFTQKLSRQNVTAWAGLRPMSADGVPVISKTPVDNLYVNSGHGHLGWTFAAASGRLLSDLVSGQTSEIEIDDYRLAGR